jgi:hypothetical protein
MKIHIVGSGPTGVSIAWELSRYTDHEITMYDKKPSIGGSWWEPPGEKRDVHAHRALFDKAFVNTHSLFSEMDISWDDMFVPEQHVYTKVKEERLSHTDYVSLASLAVRVLLFPSEYKRKNVKESVGKLSPHGQNFMKTITYVMDGVGWDVMTAYEFIQNANHIGLSTMYTQRGSGTKMNDAMFRALDKRGVKFIGNKTMKSVEYYDEGYAGTFDDGTIINSGMLVMCVDNSSALKLIGNNWKDARDKMFASTYGSLTVMLDYDAPIILPKEHYIAMNTKWNLIPEKLEGSNSVACVICNLTEKILATPPDQIKEQVVKQLSKLGIREPDNVRIAWGSYWTGHKWEFTQSAGVLSVNGQVPFFGNSSRVALCGMMSERHTPYSSIEAAIEVGRSFCNQTFKTRKPLRPILVTDVLIVLIVLILIMIYTR